MYDWLLERLREKFQEEPPAQATAASGSVQPAAAHRAHGTAARPAAAFRGNAEVYRQLLRLHLSQLSPTLCEAASREEEQLVLEEYIQGGHPGRSC